MSLPQEVEKDWEGRWADLGETAYEAYYEASQGLSLITGEVLPLWEELTTNIKAAWIVAAKAVAINVERNGNA